MYQYFFEQKAVGDIKKLPKDIQKRIIKKLDFFCSKDPLIFACHLKNYELGTYRFRIGDYRVIFDLEEDRIIILAVGHRREIYK